MPAPDASIHRAIQGLQRLAELFAERRRQLAREAGLAEGEWQVLEEIAGERFMPSLFARRRRVSPAAISRTLRGLKARGCVRDEIAPRDARQRAYRLTAEGRRVLARLRASRARAVEAIWAPLPAADLVRFGRFAGELADRLEAYATRSDADARAPALRGAGAARTAARAPAGATRRGRARRRSLRS